MNRAVLITTFVAALLGCAGRAPSIPGSSEPTDPVDEAAAIDQQFLRADEAYRRGDYVEAERITSHLLVTDSLSRVGRLSTLILRSNARVERNDQAGALRDLDAALLLADGADVGLVEFNRFHRLLALDRDDDAARALLVTASYPEHIHDVGLRAVRDVLKPLQLPGREAELLEVLIGLQQAGYHGRRDDAPSDLVASMLTRELMRAGRAEEARAVARTLRRYPSFIELRTVGLFAPMWADPAFDREFAVSALPRIALARAQQEHDRAPRKLWGVTNLVRALRLNGRHDEAISVAKEGLGALARFDHDDGDELWLMNELAYTYESAGRRADADAVFEPLLALDPKGNNNAVNQQINYGLMLMWRGEHDRAMAAAKRAEPGASEFGKRFIRQVEACGLARTGHREAADRIIDTMLADPADNLAAVMAAAICAGREVDAERVMLQRLADEGERYRVIGLFDGCISSANEAPLARQQREALARMRTSPAIAAAIAAVGMPIEEPVGCADD